MDIHKNDTSKINIELEKGYKILFTNKLPQNTTITISNDETSMDHAENDIIVVRSGKWTVTLKNKNFVEKKIAINVIDKDYTIDYIPEFYKSTITFKNLPALRKVYINNEDVTDLILDNKIEFNIGEYTVKVTNSKDISFTDKIIVEKDKETIVKVVFQKSASYYRKNANIFLGAGIATSLTGLIMTITGLVINLNLDPVDTSNNTVFFGQYQQNLSSNFSDYQSYSNAKYITLCVFIAGAVLSTAGIAFICVSIPLYYKSNKYSLNFDLNINKNIELAITYKYK